MFGKSIGSSQSDPQQTEATSGFQNFENYYNQLLNIDISDQSQMPFFEETIINACKAIQDPHSKIPTNFVVQTKIISFLKDLLEGFSVNPPIFEKISILLFYVLNGSKQALVDFLQTNPIEYIMRLFNSDNLKERHICYEILVRLNDPICKSFDFQKNCEDLNVYQDIIQRTIDILDNYSLQDPANSSYNTNIQALLKVIVGLPNILHDISPYKDSLFYIFNTILNYSDENIRILYSKYALYSLFFLAKDPLYIEIIDNGLFQISMQFIEYEQTASLATLLALQMLQVSTDGECEEKVKELLPIEKSHDYFITTNDYQLLKYILTLYTNSIIFHPTLKNQLATEGDLNRLNELMQDENADIQQRAVWCIWNMLRFGELEIISNILSFEDLPVNLVDLSFVMEDISFVKSVLVPSIITVSKKIRAESLDEQDPFKSFLESLIEPLKDLCYKEGAPEIMCLAASCLKNVFPDQFNAESFPN